MVENNWLDKMSGQLQLKAVLDTNAQTADFDLVLTPQEAQVLLAERQSVLKHERRVEFGEGILPKLILTFCSSRYITQESYVPTLARLQEIFFLYKNELADEITDDELLGFMQEQFETICCGDLDYLEGTCLDIFAQAVRAGYQSYKETQGRSSFAALDIVKRWDKELYLETLRDLIWR